MIRRTEKEQESGKGREVETRVQGTEMKGWALLTLETLNRALTSLTKSTLVVPIPMPSLTGFWVWAGCFVGCGFTEGDMGRARPGSFPEEGHSRWVDNPDQGPEEEKKRLKFIRERLINSFKYCKLPMSELCRHKLYLLSEFR